MRINQTIARRISPDQLAQLVGGQKPNGRRLKRRYGICDTITPAHVARAFKDRDIRIMPKTATAIHSNVMLGVKITWRGVKIHADKRRNNLFAYRI